MAQADAKPLDGKIALVTGANTGIGRVTAVALAAQGAQVFVACRSAKRAQGVLDEIGALPNGGKAELLPLELGDFASVRQCANTFLARGLPLHLLVNNAGLAGARGYTKSGFELAFGVNHMGHFLLTQLLLDRIKDSAPARIVTIASKAHYGARGIDWQAVREPTRTKMGLDEYGVSKLANVLFSAELGRRLAGSGVTTYSLHPGVVATEVWRAVPWPFGWLLKLALISPEKGARTSLHCATSAGAAAETGLYYDECRPKTPSRVARDEALAKALWERSEQWVR
jgi:NAD(P)-dependent dehydrogenase (short-subunit alcohol dehydrogenase family)